MTNRINQLPDFAARWLLESKICFFTYLVKSHKIHNNPTTTEAREETSTDLESLEFFLMYIFF